MNVPKGVEQCLYMTWNSTKAQTPLLAFSQEKHSVRANGRYQNVIYYTQNKVNRQYIVWWIEHITTHVACFAVMKAWTSLAILLTLPYNKMT